MANRTSRGGILQRPPKSPRHAPQPRKQTHNEVPTSSRGGVRILLLPMPDYQGFSYEGEQHDPMGQPGPAAEYGPYQAVRQIVGVPSIEHATVYARTDATKYANTGAEEAVYPPSRRMYLNEVGIARPGAGYKRHPAKRPAKDSVRAQRALVYPGYPYAIQARAPSLDETRAFMAGVAQLR